MRILRLEEKNCSIPKKISYLYKSDVSQFWSIQTCSDIMYFTFVLS